MPHVALLGDSIFDNRAYVGGGPDVISQLRARLPASWTATLLARDGARIAGIGSQLARLPTDVTHIVVSVGGNDALASSGVLDRQAPSIAQALIELASISASFEQDYAAMLALVAAAGRRIAVCTIYDPSYPDPMRQRLARTALMVLNDPIVRLAGRRGLPLVDLRLVCDEPADYANPIEPSVQGGEKIASAIAGMVQDSSVWSGRSTVHVGGEAARSRVDPQPAVP